MITMVTKRYSDFFAKYPTEENADQYIDCIATSLDIYDSLVDDYGYSKTAVHDEFDLIVVDLYSTLVSIKQYADTEFGTERSAKTDKRWEDYLDKVDNVIYTMEVLIKLIPMNAEYIEKFRKLYYECTYDSIDSCSYEFSPVSGRYEVNMLLTDGAKKVRINAYKEIDRMKPELLAKAEKREREYHSAKNEEYWEEHEDEKKNLLERINELKEQKKPYDEQIIQIDNEIKEIRADNKNPINEEKVVSIIEDKIKSAKRALKSFGLLDFKGRKPLKIKIKQLNSELKEAEKLAYNARYEANTEMKNKVTELVRQKNRFLDKITDLTKKINGVNNELNRDR